MLFAFPIAKSGTKENKRNKCKINNLQNVRKCTCLWSKYGGADKDEVNSEIDKIIVEVVSLKQLAPRETIFYILLQHSSAGNSKIKLKCRHKTLK